MMSEVLEDFDFFDCIVEGLRQVGQSVQVSIVTDTDVTVVLQFDGVEYLEVLRLGEIAEWTSGVPASAHALVKGQRNRLGYKADVNFQGLMLMCKDNYPFLTIIFTDCKVIS